ncbi:hypothetical protein [Priestia megaterium]|uniref:hypothetical protein n=1 Tax=Priestia megaterium TaxID=1404 RepID=UPI002DBD9624|nr:hypothetical protein [Priestia megaterium]MEC1071406.1 hypothetical protein [Priestia megaterium]
MTKFQYNSEGDITSLVEAVVQFLYSLGAIDINDKKQISSKETQLDVIDIHLQLSKIAQNLNEPSNPNYIFATMFYELFVKSNNLFIHDLHFETNNRFKRISISQEKINAWKRMMEYFGLGYRYNGGFYALPQYKLIKDLINYIGDWEGPLHVFFEDKVHPIIPCVYKGNVYNGIIFSILNLNSSHQIQLTRKQDLPFQSYGEKSEWNWITVRSESCVTLFK